MEENINVGNENPVSENTTPETKMEENVTSNVIPETPAVVNEESKEVSEPTPITEKLEEEAEKQNIDMPPVVTETAEAAINAASAASGETTPDPKKVSVKKPTKKDPIILYDNNVVLWFIPVE
jgi:hypothetical protein